MSFRQIEAWDCVDIGAVRDPFPSFALHLLFTLVAYILVNDDGEGKQMERGVFATSQDKSQKGRST